MIITLESNGNDWKITVDHGESHPRTFCDISAQDGETSHDCLHKALDHIKQSPTLLQPEEWEQCFNFYGSDFYRIGQHRFMCPEIQPETVEAYNQHAASYRMMGFFIGELLGVIEMDQYADAVEQMKGELPSDEVAEMHRQIALAMELPIMDKDNLPS